MPDFLSSPPWWFIFIAGVLVTPLGNAILGYCGIFLSRRYRRGLESYQLKVRSNRIWLIRHHRRLVRNEYWMRCVQHHITIRYISATWLFAAGLVMVVVESAVAIPWVGLLVIVSSCVLLMKTVRASMIVINALGYKAKKVVKERMKFPARHEVQQCLEQETV